ncbi:MAG: DNA repair exonuclease [Clostridiales bacterium]|nr:DNA repair exonuclease [Clostridiales bacterium]
MGLKILHAADLHLDSPFGGFSDEQRQLLKAQQRLLPGKIADLCRRETCDLMLLAGDIFDGEASRESMDVLKEALARCGVPAFVAPGNHDFCCPSSPWLTESWPENVYIFTGGLESVVLEDLSCRVYGAGFRSMDCPSLLEGFRAEGTEQYKIAVLHGDPTQRESPYNPITAGQVKASGLQYLALGHIHKAGAFRAGNTLCVWPGCPMGRGWDETGDKGVCIVTLEDEAKVQAVSLDTIRFYDLEADVGADAVAALESLLPPQGSRDFYRIALTGNADVDLKSVYKEFPDFPNLFLLDKTEPPMDLWENTDADTLEGMYFQLLRRRMEEEPENARQIQLAAEISRKLLSGREVTL